MSITSVKYKTMLTTQNGGLTVPVLYVSETYADIADHTTYYLDIGGVTLDGSILGLTEPDPSTPGSSIIYCPIKSNGGQVFPQYSDVLYYVEQNYIVHISRHIQAGDDMFSDFWVYGNYDNPKYGGRLLVFVVTSDGKTVWGLTTMMDMTLDDNIYEYPNNATFGYYHVKAPTGQTLAITSDRVSQAAQDLVGDMLGISRDVSDDPYALGGNSAVGGGQGTFSGLGGSVGFSALPTLSAVSTGFITLFNPTATQMGALASYMWNSSLFDLDTWQKLWADPMDAILGLSIVPVAVPNGGSIEVKVGNISTGVHMNRAASQYVTVDCGSVQVGEYWGGYLDYDPYTKIELYLPYIGTHALSTDDCMGKSVHVKYNVDILSGACVAEIACGGQVMYNYIGQCSASIPISGTDWTAVINGIISASTAIGSMVATGGATAPMAVPALASTAVNGMKPNVEKSGSLSGMGGMLGIQTPYLIITRPRQAKPEDQNTFTGYPSFITETLGSLSGYTEVEVMHLEGIHATESELNEIESLLKSGVIF